MDANSKRSRLSTAVNVWQLLLGLLLAGLAIYLLALTGSRDTLADPDAADTVHGLLIGALVLGIPAVITLIAVWGLWQRRFWGWALSLATDVGVLAVLAYDVLREHDRGMEQITLGAGFIVPIILLLMPRVRKCYWHATS